MSEDHNQDSDVQEEGAKFKRGSALSIFANDRHEDFMALLFALLVALGVFFLVG